MWQVKIQTYQVFLSVVATDHCNKLLGGQGKNSNNTKQTNEKKEIAN